jgi:hypothetical protein
MPLQVVPKIVPKIVTLASGHYKLVAGEKGPHTRHKTLYAKLQWVNKEVNTHHNNIGFIIE